MPLTFVGMFNACVFGSICLTWPGPRGPKAYPIYAYSKKHDLLLYEPW